LAALILLLHRAPSVTKFKRQNLDAFGKRNVTGYCRLTHFE